MPARVGMMTPRDPREEKRQELRTSWNMKLSFFFPLRKIKRNGTHVLAGVLLLALVGVTVYRKYVAANTWNDVEDILKMERMEERHADQGLASFKDFVWSSKFIPQPWRPTYKGKANLHVYEDWCGSSVASLRKNPHFPLYPHSRITVKKLAVSPSWRNYGLRIFGYIHPYISGEFLFAVASSFNCEFWLSEDENPDNLRLRAYVGKTGEEWSAPGEYGKYASQISKPVLLQQDRRFYFELIYKHADGVSNHVEVAWRLDQTGSQFKLIDSNSLSLYTDESSMKMSEVSHIPQTAACYIAPPLEKATEHHRVEMLREDPRDSFFTSPLVDVSRLEGVLLECSHKPGNAVNGRTISRYQGLQFVHLTYVYPNDYTRLTHMENDNTCFYRLMPNDLKIFGFSQYMSLDQPEEQDMMFRDDGDYGEDGDYGDYRAGLRGFKMMRREEPDHKSRDKNDTDYHDDYVQNQDNPRNRAKTRHLRRTEKEQKELISHVTQLEGKAPVPDQKDSETINLHHPIPSKVPNEEAEPWATYGDSDVEMGSDGTYDPEIRWNQTFHAAHTDFQLPRTDRLDLSCNVSGNLLINQSEVTAVVQEFMNKLELKFPRTFSLLHIVNVEKRVNEGRGTHYLLELELMESRRRVRLVHYVYAEKTSVTTGLCNTHTFRWNPEATVHIIVPVKNQARWVQRFIADMEKLYLVTGDNNINIIIIDYSSTDMDIEKALSNSQLPRFQFLRLTGNFEKSAGLQAGIDLIQDSHSIAFLCDLHLHFPQSFFDSVRTHCVEGHMVFAPLVMRLDCGATPEEPNGYWEVNGFGLLGIYKSDLDAVGGMNTREYTNRWGGEDWELLDRIMEAGLEVDRLHLRNFFHYHHSKRSMWDHRPLRST